MKLMVLEVDLAENGNIWLKDEITQQQQYKITIYMQIFSMQRASSLLAKLLLFQFLLILSLTQTPEIQTNQTTNSTVFIPSPGWLQWSQSQLNTFLTDKYNYFITPKGNRVWGCAMNLAWNEMKRGLLNGEDVVLGLTQRDVIAKKIADNLNAGVFTREELSEEAYYVRSGVGPETIRKINFEVSQKFQQRTFQPLNDNIGQQSLVSFAYLFKKFQYKTAFAQKNNFKFKSVKVPGFQALTSKQRSQLYIKYYNNDSDFMIGIQTSNQNDEILLLKTSIPQLNSMRLQKVISLIDMYSSQPSLKFDHTDKFMMPVLEFDYTRVYQEMTNKQLLNEGFEKYYIGKMMERVKLKVDRFGVRLENEAVMIMWTSQILDQRRFYLNDNFWLILREKNKKPYFIMLVTDVKESWTSN